MRYNRKKIIYLLTLTLTFMENIPNLNKTPISASLEKAFPEVRDDFAWVIKSLIESWEIKTNSKNYSINFLKNLTDKNPDDVFTMINLWIIYFDNNDYFESTKYMKLIEEKWLKSKLDIESLIVFNIISWLSKCLSVFNWYAIWIINKWTILHLFDAIQHQKYCNNDIVSHFKDLIYLFIWFYYIFIEKNDKKWIENIKEWLQSSKDKDYILWLLRQLLNEIWRIDILDLLDETPTNKQSHTDWNPFGSDYWD